MPITSMGASHLAGQSGNFEPQRGNNAVLIITGLDALVVPASAFGSGGTGSKESVLTLALDSFPLPKVTNNPVEMGYLNETRKVAGKPVFDDLTIVFKDLVDIPVASVLQKWRYLVYNPESGRMGLAASYKKSGLIRLYGPDGTTEREYELIGCWPSALDLGEIDMMSEEPVKITMTMTYDKYIPRVGVNPFGNK